MVCVCVLATKTKMLRLAINLFSLWLGVSSLLPINDVLRFNLAQTRSRAELAIVWSKRLSIAF